MKRDFQMKKLFKDYFAVISGTAMGRSLSFITSLILAHSMDIHNFGIFSLFFTVIMLVGQIPTIIDAIYVRYAKVGVKENRIEYIRITFFMKAIISLLLLFLAYPAGLFLASHIFNKPEMAFYIIAAIIAGAFLSLFSTVSSFYQAQEDFYAFSISGLLFYALVFVIIMVIALTHFTFTPFIVSAVYGVSALLIGSLGIIYLYNITKPLFPIQTVLLGNMLHFGKWLFAESLVYIILQRIDVLFLARVVNYEELGLYSAAVRMAMLASILTSSATTIFMPRGCESLQSIDRLKSYLKGSLMVVSGLTMLIITLIVVSPVVIKLFFGSQYINCLLPTRILLLDSIFVLLYTPFSFLFYANGNTRQIFNLGVLKFVISIAGLIFLVPRYGSIGAAWSIAISSFMGLAFVIIASSKILLSFANPHCRCVPMRVRI